MRILLTVLCFISFTVQAKEINTLTDVISLLGSHKELNISVPVDSEHGRNVYETSNKLYFYNNSGKIDHQDHSFSFIHKDRNNYMMTLKTERNATKLNDLKEFTVETPIGKVDIYYFGGEVLRASIYNEIGYGRREDKDIDKLKGQIFERLNALGFERTKDKGGFPSFFTPDSRNFFKKDNIYVSVSKLYRSDVIVTNIFVHDYNSKVKKANEAVRNRLEERDLNKINEFYK